MRSLRKLAVITIASSLFTIGRAGAGALDLDQVRLFPVPLDLNDTPLTNALGRIDVAANAIKGNLVLFGIEVRTKHGNEPVVKAHIPAGSTLREALSTVFQAVPDYAFEVAAPHLVNVFPVGAATDPDNPMNVRIAAFSLFDVSPSNFICNPPRYIPELKAALNPNSVQEGSMGPGLSDKAPGINAWAVAVTVREAMNLVTEESIASAQDGRGDAWGWIYAHEMFPANGRPAHFWRAQDVWDLRKHPK